MPVHFGRERRNGHCDHTRQSSGVAAASQLYEELRQSILSGRLAPGQRVPSTRAFAASLGVSRATVTQSYEQLLSEGIFKRSRVPALRWPSLPDDLLRPAAVKSAVRVARAARISVRLSNYGANLADAEGLEPPSRELPITSVTGDRTFRRVSATLSGGDYYCGIAENGPARDARLCSKLAWA